VEEERRVTAVVEAWARDSIAMAQRESGRVDPHLVNLRRTLAAAVERSPELAEMNDGGVDLSSLARNLLSSLGDGAESYARTGATREALVERSAPTDVPRTSGATDYTAVLMKGGAGLRDFGDGRMGKGLYVELEFRQSASGAALGLSLVRSSGVATFDHWVLGRAASVLAGVPARDAGSSENVRSLWAFHGRVTYKRALEDATVKDDSLYLVAGALAQVLTGTFDEVRGTAEYVDLRHPRYECTVKLLRSNP
jgi:hypothetical protein